MSFLVIQESPAQNSKHIQWLSFEQLEDSLVSNPKKIVIDFYADWCVYCKKMDRVAFKDTEIISELNRSYHAVKLDVETQDTIRFGGEVLFNRQIGTKRTPVHDIALRLASRPEQAFSLPAIIILNEDFEVMARYFRYLSPTELKKILYQFSF